MHKKKKNPLSGIVRRPVFTFLWGMENIEEKSCLCALNRIFGFEPKYALALIGHLGSASEVFRLSDKELFALTGPRFKYKGDINARSVCAAKEELIRLESAGVSFCGWTENDYPTLLRECEDAPVGLYIRSVSKPSELWRSGESIAVVGTRDISPYGREWCGKMVRHLSHSAVKPCIVSGLALGTDIEAHKTALDSGLPTIGVMATGPDSIYPYRHREFALRMARTPGCALVTDYPPGTAPLAVHFLRRNRIIAGLSRASILVESKIKGGGMMTCRLAFSYNRDVFALPGRIDDVRSQGCNELIRQKIAEPVTSLSMLSECLGLPGSYRKREGDSAESAVIQRFSGSTDSRTLERMCLIIRQIRKHRGITLEDLAGSLGMPYREVSQTAGLLEIEGFITIDILQRCCINHKID